MVYAQLVFDFRNIVKHITKHIDTRREYVQLQMG